MKLLLILLLCLPACGKTGIGTGIAVKMHPIYAAATYLSIDKLQIASNNKAVEYNNVSTPAIIIEYATNEELSNYGAYILGLATVSIYKPCRIQITTRTFNYGQDVLDSVIWHEIGHCYGMDHTNDENDIMYQYAKPLSMYSKDVINNFLRRLHEETN